MLAMLSKFGRVYRSDLWQQVDGEGTQVLKNMVSGCGDLHTSLPTSRDCHSATL